MSTSQSGGGPGKVICDMDDHGVHGEMKNDAMSVAAAALEANPASGLCLRCCSASVSSGRGVDGCLHPS